MSIANGSPSSAAELQAQFAALSAQGQSVLDDIATTRETTLLRFDQGLSALNSRQQRAARINAPDIVCRFVTSDMLDIDQTLTSAAVRADAGAVTLRERQKPSNAAIKNLTFSSNTGAIEQFNNMYRVHVVDGSTPVGTFQIELFNPSELTLVVFDIVSMPSDPGIRVFASADGVTQVEASAISRSRYRVNAWFPAMAVKYLQIQIAPTHPDTIGGSAFTFGLTSFSAVAMDYWLFSELVTKPVVVGPMPVKVFET
jgi:hypothetical protein